MRLLVDFEIAAGDAARGLRQAFDRNHDGALDPGEQQGLVEHLARAATLRTELSVDGAPLPLHRDAARGEKVDEPASSGSLLAVRVELSAPWPPAQKKNILFFGLFSHPTHELVLSDEDPAGHVPVTVECEACTVTAASSGLADGSRVRGAETPLRLTVRP